jgi:hypothetical protein
MPRTRLRALLAEQLPSARRHAARQGTRLQVGLAEKDKAAQTGITTTIKRHQDGCGPGRALAMQPSAHAPPFHGMSAAAE